MTLIIILLLVAFIIIWNIPTQYQEVTVNNSCEQHVWVEKPSGLEDVSYMVCEKCKLLPNTVSREESDS